MIEATAPIQVNKSANLSGPGIFKMLRIPVNGHWRRENCKEKHDYS